MTEYYLNSESIECESSDIYGRKILFKGIVKLNNIGQCTKYNCDRNSEAIILKELTPRIARYNNNSKLNLNDNLKATGISVYSEGIKIYKITIKNYSHTHKINNIITNNYTYATITKPFQQIINALNKKIG